MHKWRHKHTLKNRLLIQKQSRLIFICVLLSWWMFGCFSYSTQWGKKPTHTHLCTDIVEGLWDRLGGIFSTRLGLNMSCLLRSSLHHHHPLHTELVEILTSQRQLFSQLPLCPLSARTSCSTGQCCSRVQKYVDVASKVVENVKSWEL